MSLGFMTGVRFSVIVPLYNKAQYIKRTIESVLHQTYSDFELIVVDDGSTDDSLEMAKSVVGSNKEKCIVIAQANSGVSCARNEGVALSKGKYVCFLDSDDWWEPRFLEEINRLIESYPDAGLYGTGFYLVKNGRKKIAPIGVEAGFVKGYINYCQVYAETMCMPISSSSVVIPKDIFDSSGRFRSGITLGEDFDLWIRITLKYPVVLLNRPLSNYFQDIPIKNRATRKLRDPNSHILWNLDYLEEEEKQNHDLKILLDKMRASGLLRFYLSFQYHEEAMRQLSKIDWRNVPQNEYYIYHSPLSLQRIRFWFLNSAAFVKQYISLFINNNK